MRVSESAIFVTFSALVVVFLTHTGPARALLPTTEKSEKTTTLLSRVSFFIRNIYCRRMHRKMI